MSDVAITKLIEVAPYGGFAILLGLIFSSLFKLFVKSLERSFDNSLKHIKESYDQSVNKSLEIIKLLQEKAA